ncbi:MAG: TolC family protein [Chitinophagaceae bacterium]|nr:TolC family protein [Chitinophagaceae bacterium]
MNRILFLFFTIISFSASAQQLSLKQCIDTALKNNIQVQQSGLLKQSAHVNKQQAKANLLPSVNGNWNYGFNFGRNVDPITNTFTTNQLSSSNVSASAGVVLFNGMRLQNLIQQTGYSYKAAEMDYKQAQDNLVLNVILAYMQVVAGEDILTVSKAQLSVTKKQIERMEVLVKEGSAGNFQLTDMKGQMANEEINIINLENSLQQSKLSLCQLMNISYDPALSLERSAVVLNDAVYAQTSPEVIAAAFQYLALVKANDFRVKSAEKNIQVVKGALYPTLSLSGATGSSYSSLFTKLTPTGLAESNTGLYIKNGSLRTPVFAEQQNFSKSNVAYITQMQNNLGFFTGLNLQIPLFNTLQARNRIKLAKINFKNTQLDAENTNYQLKQNIEQAWLNMNASFKRYKALQEQLINFEESFRAATVRFESGVINAAEFLIAKNNADRSKINLVQAKYEYTFRSKLLDFYQGKNLW